MKSHNCVNIIRDLLPINVLSIHDRLRRSSNVFKTNDEAIISLLNEHYDYVKMWHSYAIRDYIDLDDLLRGPLSMQGDYAYLLKTNGKEACFKPKFKNHFTLNEFSKLLKKPFTSRINGSMAIFYSTSNNLEYNKNASKSYGIDLYGDVIILPSCLSPNI
jgi:hypothetical protein